MEALLIIIIAVALGLGYGTKNATRAVGERYKARRDRWLAASGLADEAVAAGHGSRARARGLRVGAAAATVVTGGRLGWRAFRHGWREGWPQGRDRAPGVMRWLTRWFGGAADLPGRTDRPNRCQWVEDGQPCGRRRNGEYCRRHTQAWQAGQRSEEELPASEPESTPPSATVRAVPAATPNSTVTARVPARPKTPSTRTAPAPPSTGKGASMAIETRTGGEVLTRDQFEREMQAVIAESTAELEDAQGDARRAQQDTQRVEYMAASMSSMEIDSNTVIAVRRLVDTNSARIANARLRVSAAEQRKTAAENALQVFRAALQTQFHAG